MTTLSIGNKVTPIRGANKGDTGIIRDEKRNETGYGDRFVTDFLVAWDTGGASWQSPSNLVRVEDK